MTFCHQLLKRRDLQVIFLITSGKQMTNKYVPSFNRINLVISFYIELSWDKEFHIFGLKYSYHVFWISVLWLMRHNNVYAIKIELWSWKQEFKQKCTKCIEKKFVMKHLIMGVFT